MDELVANVEKEYAD